MLHIFYLKIWDPPSSQENPDFAPYYVVCSTNMHERNISRQRQIKLKPGPIAFSNLIN